MENEPVFQGSLNTAAAVSEHRYCICLRHYTPDPLITHPALRPDQETSAAGNFLVIINELWEQSCSRMEN